MVFDGLFAVPTWLLVGLALGVVASLLAAGVFVLADRYFPDRREYHRRHSGESRRRVELREYLDAIGEPYAENHAVEGQRVAFYLPAREVAITFDARAYYRIGRSQTVAVLVEHEMPATQLGHRLPFEVPNVNVDPPSDAANDDPITAAFAELGVSTSATLEEVKAAYRRRVKEAHPDHGGDEDEFRRIREAYTTAKEHAD